MQHARHLFYYALFMFIALHVLLHIYLCVYSLPNTHPRTFFAVNLTPWTVDLVNQTNLSESVALHGLTCGLDSIGYLGRRLPPTSTFRDNILAHRYELIPKPTKYPERFSHRIYAIEHLVLNP